MMLTTTKHSIRVNPRLTGFMGMPPPDLECGVRTFPRSTFKLRTECENPSKKAYDCQSPPKTA